MNPSRTEAPGCEYWRGGGEGDVALATGALALIGLLLYPQARQRSQVIASALGRRMGFGRLREALSLCIEVAGIVLFAALVGGTVAIRPHGRS